MIKDNQTLFNRLHVVLDGAAVAVSYSLAFLIWFYTPIAKATPGVDALSTEQYFSALYFLIPLFLILYSATNLYTPKRGTRARTEVWSIIRANTIGIAAVMIIFYLMSGRYRTIVDFSRGLIVLFYLMFSLSCTG